VIFHSDDPIELTRTTMDRLALQFPDVCFSMILSDIQATEAPDWRVRDIRPGRHLIWPAGRLSFVIADDLVLRFTSKCKFFVWIIRRQR